MKKKFSGEMRHNFNSKHYVRQAPHHQAYTISMLKHGGGSIILWARFSAAGTKGLASSQRGALKKDWTLPRVELTVHNSAQH